MKGSLPIIITQSISCKKPMCFSTTFFLLLVYWWGGWMGDLDHWRQSIMKHLATLVGNPWLRHSSHPERSVKLYCLHDHVITPLCKQHCECTHQLSSSSSNGFFPFLSFFLCLQWPILWCHQSDHHPQKRKKKNRKKEPNSPTSPTMKVF